MIQYPYHTQYCLRRFDIVTYLNYLNLPYLTWSYDTLPHLTWLTGWDCETERLGGYETTNSFHLHIITISYYYYYYFIIILSSSYYQITISLLLIILLWSLFIYTLNLFSSSSCIILIILIISSSHHIIISLSSIKSYHHPCAMCSHTLSESSNN